MPPIVLHYLITQIRVRFAAIRSGELDRGALSLEWVVIAIALVGAATLLVAYLRTKIGSMETNIGNG
jgi:hypothetical protein